MSIETRLQLRTTNSLHILNTLRSWLMQTRVQIANGGASAPSLSVKKTGYSTNQSVQANARPLFKSQKQKK